MISNIVRFLNIVTLGHIERRQREKEELRNKILDAALDIAISEGWKAVTIRKIANNIKYAPPIVYEYFKNKDDLLNKLVQVGHQLLSRNFKSASKKESDPRKKLMIISIKFWEFAFKHKELYQLMFSLNRQIPNDELHAQVQEIAGVFEEIVGNNEIAKEAMFSWMCFQQGYIYNIKQMGLPPDLSHNEPKELFMRAMKKFISKI